MAKVVRIKSPYLTGISPIEDDVPIPSGGGHKPSLFPFSEMNVGESFTIPIEERPRVNSGIRYRKIKYKEEYVTRRVGDRLRVWRVG